LTAHPFPAGLSSSTDAGRPALFSTGALVQNVILLVEITDSAGGGQYGKNGRQQTGKTYQRMKLLARREAPNIS